MEKIVLTIGGLIKSLTLSDLFFFAASLILILLLVYIIYLIRTDDDDKVMLSKDVNDSKENVNEKRKVNDAIEDIINNLETNYEPKPIDLSRYEQEMEDTAIISYDELRERTTNNISYEDEYDSGIEDVVVKKVDSTNMSNTKELVDLPKAVMMSYESEEAFVKALKVLQSNLVR